MKKLFLATALLASTVASASAADMAARTYTKAPVIAAPVYSWTGFYVGGFVGGAFGMNNGITDPVVGGITTSRKDSVFFGGGQAGFNYQFAPNWVVGIEGDIGALSTNDLVFTDGAGNLGFGTAFARDRTEWLASVAGRLGYTWGAGMIYGKGGAAFRDNNGFTSSLGFSSNRHDSGYSAGGGLEYMFAPYWSAKIEYQYYDFGRTTVSTALTPVIFRYRDDFHTVKAGINYHFNWGGPVVAKY